MITRIGAWKAELRQLRSSLGDLTGNLDRLRAQLRDIELQAESQMQSRLAQAKGFSRRSTRWNSTDLPGCRNSRGMMAEVVNDVATVQTQPAAARWESTEDDLIAQAGRRASCSATCCARAWWSSREFPSASTE